MQFENEYTEIIQNNTRQEAALLFFIFNEEKDLYEKSFVYACFCSFHAADGRMWKRRTG